MSETTILKVPNESVLFTRSQNASWERFKGSGFGRTLEGDTGSLPIEFIQMTELQIPIKQ